MNFEQYRQFDGITGLQSRAIGGADLTTLAGLAAVMGSAEPLDLWLCNESSGNLASDGSNTLTSTGSPLYEAAAPDALGTAVSADGNTDGFTAATSAVHDFAGADFAILLVFRSGTGAANHSLLEKRDGSGYGYQIRTDSSNRLRFYLNSSVTGNHLHILSASDWNNDAWSSALCIHEEGVGSRIFTSRAETSTLATSLGSLTNTGTLRLLGGQYTGAGCDVAYAALWSDITGLDSDALSAFNAEAGL